MAPSPSLPSPNSPLATPFKFHILPASACDIPTLAYIHVEALKDDASAAVKFADRDEFQAKVEEMLRGQIPEAEQEDGSSEGAGGGRGEESESRVGEWVVIKAVIPNDEGGGDEKIVGWASWLHEDPASTPEDSPSDPSSEDNEDKPEPGKDVGKVMTFPTGLGAYVRANQTRLYRSWHQQHRPPHTSNTPSNQQGCLSLRACFVLSSFRRLGIGRALVEYGCELADRLMLNTLVTATPVGKGLYERVGGFVVFEVVSVDLERGDWGKEGGKEREGGMDIRDGEDWEEKGRWYRFWFLARQYRPRSSVLGLGVSSVEAE
ncbi:hypothetical protein H2200_001208 [Cladophialophora chaetospira]|uniref:N-acetyltransferase domain-containing protein n=1 Tax=Cladophialophora chaetospira TaxID=386627 RepID=A0AA38XKF7_9EURO|nr:hypothetical protein H2200_001208 [Cladophialophora chaetospira]